MCTPGELLFRAAIYVCNGIETVVDMTVSSSKALVAKAVVHAGLICIFLIFLS